MTDYHWPTIRDHTTRTFGELPHADTEAAILEIFELQPSVVTRILDEVAEDVAAGKVRSGWAVTRSRLNDAGRPAAEITISENRDASVQQAERYIANAGAYYDRWDTELEDELFGDRGRLHPWHTDEGLRDRLHRLWQAHRPRGEHADHQQHEDAQRHREQRAALAADREQRRLAGEQASTAALQQLIDQANARGPTTDDDIPF